MQIHCLDLSFSMNLHAEDELLSNIIREKGFYSFNDLLIMRRLLHPGDCFVDVGANIGWHSVFAAQWVGAHGQVYAFEPEKKNFDVLTENLRPWPQAKAVALALGDRAGELPLVINSQNRGDHRVDFGVLKAGCEAQTISMTTLDKFFSKATYSKIRFVKMDAQGSEAKILRGGEEIFRQVRPFIQVEFSPAHLRFCNDSFFDLFSFMDRLQYRPLWIQEKLGLKAPEVLKPVSIIELMQYSQDLDEKNIGIDLLLVPAEALQSFANSIRTA